MCVCVHINPFHSCCFVQVAPKVSTFHYTMAVIMYMRVSEEGGKGGEGRGGEGREGEGEMDGRE